MEERRPRCLWILEPSIPQQLLEPCFNFPHHHLMSKASFLGKALALSLLKPGAGKAKNSSTTLAMLCVVCECVCVEEKKRLRV